MAFFARPAQDDGEAHATDPIGANQTGGLSPAWKRQKRYSPLADAAIPSGIPIKSLLGSARSLPSRTGYKTTIPDKLTLLA
jgi:hypothetical protein